MGSNNSKVQGVVVTLKTLWEQVRYLDVFCYIKLLRSLQVWMYKKSKQMFQGHVTDIITISMSFF